MTGPGTTSTNSCGTSLKERIEQKLKPDLLAPVVRISDYRELPFAILLYAPNQEFELRHELGLLEKELFQKAGRMLKLVSMAALMWEAIDRITGREALFAAERAEGLDRTIATIHNILTDENFAPLHSLVKERLDLMDPRHDVAALVRAGSLFPVYRTSALLANLQGVQVPTVLCYPGHLEGAKGLSFMSQFQPDHNYRPRIY